MYFFFSLGAEGGGYPQIHCREMELWVFDISWVKCRLERMILCTAFPLSWQWGVF